MGLVKDKKLRAVFLVLAAALLAAAIFLTLTAETDLGALKELCAEVNAFGYDFYPDDWYRAGGSANASILELTGEAGILEAVEASKKAGFPSDVYKRGDVALLLGETSGGVVTAYVVNGTLELCFLQTAGGELKPLGG